MIVGRDWHPRYQIVTWVEEETGEVSKQRLEYANGKAETFYGDLGGDRSDVSLVRLRPAAGRVRTRTMVKNQLRKQTMSQGVCRKRKLWSRRGRAELEGQRLLPWASRRRQELLGWFDQLERAVGELDRAKDRLRNTFAGP